MAGSPLICPFCGTAVPLRRRRCGGCRATVRYGLPRPIVAALALAGGLAVLSASGLMETALAPLMPGALVRAAEVLLLAAGAVLLHHAARRQSVRFRRSAAAAPDWARGRDAAPWRPAGSP